MKLKYFVKEAKAIGKKPLYHIYPPIQIIPSYFWESQFSRRDFSLKSGSTSSLNYQCELTVAGKPQLSWNLNKRQCFLQRRLIRRYFIYKKGKLLINYHPDIIQFLFILFFYK